MPETDRYCLNANQIECFVFPILCIKMKQSWKHSKGIRSLHPLPLSFIFLYKQVRLIKPILEIYMKRFSLLKRFGIGIIWNRSKWWCVYFNLQYNRVFDLLIFIVFFICQFFKT